MKFSPTALIEKIIVNPLKPVSQRPKSAENFDPASLGPKQIEFAWEGLSRLPKSNLNSGLTRTWTIIAIVVGLVLIILQEYPLLLLIGSMLFVSYVLSKVPPEPVKYSISSHGVSIGDQTYYWIDMEKFFFFSGDEQSAYQGIAVDMYGTQVPRLFLTCKSSDTAKVKELLEKHITYLETPPATFSDNLLAFFKKSTQVTK